MNRFKNILVVVPETSNEPVLRQGFELARRNEAKVTLISPAGRLNTALEGLGVIPGIRTLQEETLNARRENLESIAVSWRDDGLEVETRTPTGTPFLEIIREVIRADHDMVMVAARERSQEGSRHFQSLALHLIRKCPCPVWVVSPEAPRNYGKILAAVDPQEAGEEDDRLSVLILDLATSLSRIEGSQLHVAHIFNQLILEGYHSVRHRLSTGDQERAIEQYSQLAIEKRREELEQLLSRYSLKEIPHQVHFQQGWPDQDIPNLAQKESIELMVLGTVSKGSACGHWIGTTAENIISQIGCSVLTVKPESFLSPVQLPANESRERQEIEPASATTF